MSPFQDGLCRWGAVDYMKFPKAFEKVWIIGFKALCALKKGHLQKYC